MGRTIKDDDGNLVEICVLDEGICLKCGYCLRPYLYDIT